MFGSPLSNNTEPDVVFGVFEAIHRMARVSIPRSAIDWIVDEIGGRFFCSGVEGIARFGRADSWVVDCVFELGPSDCIFVGGAVTTSVKYLGKENVLDPGIQSLKPGIMRRYRPHIAACQAMLVPRTSLHGQPIEMIRTEVQRQRREFWAFADDPDDPDRESVAKELTREVLFVTLIRDRWSILEVVDTWELRSNPLPNAPYLLCEGNVYVPLKGVG